MVKFIAYTLSLIVFAGCLKRSERNVNAPCIDNCMTFNVMVSTGLNSATPLSNAYVELGWSWPATPLGNPGRLIATGTSAGNGTVHFSFKAKATELQGGKFYISVRAGNNYFYENNGYYGIQKLDSIVNAAIHVPAKATLKIVYKNFAPVSPDDYFACMPGFHSYGSTGRGIEMKKPDGQTSNTFFSTGYGPFTRLELTGTTAGNQYTYFNILKKKNGTRVDLIDSIYIEKGKTKIYEIEY